MRQGEVRWCEFRHPDHARPAVILTRDRLVDVLNAVTVAPLTTKLSDVDSRVRLGEADGLRTLSDVNLLNVQTLPKRQVGAWLATLSPERMREIHQALAFSLGFDLYE